MSGSKDWLMNPGGRLERRKPDCAVLSLALLPDLVAFMLGVSAASGQAVFQRNAALGDRDAVSCDFHGVLSVAVSSLCQQRKFVLIETRNVSPTCLKGKQVCRH